MNEEQGEEIISLLKQVLKKLKDIEAVSEDNRDYNFDTSSKLNDSTLL